jgi:glycosyltransferase involved in cell wall biosynthesis
MRPLGYLERAAYLNTPGDEEFEHVVTEAARYGCPLERIPDRFPLDPRPLRALADLCRRLQVRIWHGHDYKSNLYGLLLRKRLGFQLVSTVHGWVHHTVRTPLYYAIDRWCLRRCDQVIAVSSELHQRCLEIGVAAERLSQIDNAVDVQAFARAAEDPEAGVEGRRLVFGALGRLEPEKGLEVLIEAFESLLERGVDAELRIAGDGSELQRLGERVAASAHSSRIALIGFCPDVAEFHRELDVFVLSSRREGMPLALLEAMAAGLPVVATRAGGVAEVLADQEGGTVVDVDDAVALADGMERLVRDPALRRRLGNDARRRVTERYGIERRARELAAVYDRCGLYE